MSADLRRFRYALEPLRQQRRWQLDALQAELGRAQRALEEAERAVEVLRGRLREASEEAARGLGEKLDPARHPRALGWLVRLRAEIAAGDERVGALRASRDEVRAACARQQQKVDVLERHHGEAIADFTQGEEARLATEADRDWLTRRGAGVRGGER